jgi:predicted amidohydrolase
LWVGGEAGELARRTSNGEWRGERSVPTDVMAGGCDAEGQVLVAGRAGKVWRQGKTGWTGVQGAGDGEITAILGLQAHDSLALSRSAKRIVPARAALPSRDEHYPDDVIGDMGLSDAERSTPRRGFTVPMLFGALTHGKPLQPGPGHCEDCYNSAILLGSSGEIQAIHDKAFLLAFGEYMPFGDRFPVLYELSPETSHFQSGTRTTPIDLSLADGRHASLGMLICYEDLLPRFARQVAVHNPNVLINLTNDAWFGQTAEPEHHLNLALMRTVEYRKWLVRSTNTGISVFIDAVGRRVAETKLTEAETLLREVPLLESTTVYATLGDWPLAVLVLLLAYTWLRTLGGSATVPRAAGPKAVKSKKVKKKSVD